MHSWLNAALWPNPSIPWPKFSPPQCKVNTTLVSLQDFAVLKFHIETGFWRAKRTSSPDFNSSFICSWSGLCQYCSVKLWDLLRDFILSSSHSTISVSGMLSPRSNFRGNWIMRTWPKHPEFNEKLTEIIQSHCLLSSSSVFSEFPEVDK